MTRRRGAMDSTGIESWYLGEAHAALTGMSDHEPKKLEFKVTVFPEEEPAVRKELERQGAALRQREVYFYDTPELALKAKRLFLRARTTEGEDPDSTVKLRPFEGGGYPAKWDQAGKDVRYEIDVVGAKKVGSLKLDGEIDAGDLKEPSKLFKGAQEDLVSESWDDIEPLGPVHAHLWELTYDTVPKKVGVEEWTLSGGPHFIELSFKADPEDEDEARQGFHALLDRLGIGHDGRPAKTEIVLAYFARTDSNG
jgi:hypothetical protein